MSGAAFILVINMVVAGLLAAAFLAIAVYDIRRVPARWMAGGYLLAMAYFAIEFSIPAVRNFAPLLVVAFAVPLSAAMAFNVAIAHKYSVAPPWRLMVGLLVAATLVVFFMQNWPRESLTRMVVYQLPYVLMTFAGLVIVRASPLKRGFLDYLLMGLLGFASLHFAAKPFLAGTLGGVGENPQAYVQSSYAAVSQTIGTVLLVAVALLVMGMMVHDVLADATSKSETDSLSGLMNRRGFEHHAETARREAARHGIPVSLVIADLDHFKRVNDTYGHACGDRVIRAFADLLKEVSGDGHVAGRIGGEEFAILLAGVNLAAARLLAEGTRSAFGTLSVDCLPADYRCTASFGIAELEPGDDFGALMRRADQALYAAKKDGRDRVRGAPAAAPTRCPEARFTGRG